MIYSGLLRPIDGDLFSESVSVVRRKRPAAAARPTALANADGAAQGTGRYCPRRCEGIGGFGGAIRRGRSGCGLRDHRADQRKVVRGGAFRQRRPSPCIEAHLRRSADAFRSNAQVRGRCRVVAKGATLWSLRLWQEVDKKAGFGVGRFDCRADIGDEEVVERTA